MVHMQDFFTATTGKRKRDEYPSHLPPGSYMPQQDGSSDVIVEFEVPFCDLFCSFFLCSPFDCLNGL
jgi:hypothetical protein